LYVASQALSANGLVATLSGSVLGGFAGVLWAVALIASIGLLFGSLGSFAWGWMEESVKMAMKGGQIAGVALLVVSVALGASQTWIGIVVVGFVL
ncbi:MAG: hypothetical protein KGH49_04355, partial [Candidatus Micrarchaeota archaeon]|nr:hypothetical protein [Candidatus Micrarchaeota archaeon]